MKLALEAHKTQVAVSGHPIQLHQLVMNLGLNAVEALSDRRGAITFTVGQVILADASAMGLPAGRYLQLVVRDDGRGVDEETLGRTFDLFCSTKPGSSGIGLMVPREIVKAHG